VVQIFELAEVLMVGGQKRADQGLIAPIDLSVAALQVLWGLLGSFVFRTARTARIWARLM